MKAPIGHRYRRTWKLPYRAAADLCGCAQHTVEKAVDGRDRGVPPGVHRARMIDDWRDVLEGGSLIRVGRSALTRQMNGCEAWDKLVASALPGAGLPTQKRDGAWAIPGGSAADHRTGGCGCNTISVRDRSLMWAQGRGACRLAGVVSFPGSDGFE